MKASGSPSRAPAAGPEVVVLVHGLWLSGSSMTLMRRRLRRCGFEAHAFSYASVRRNLIENAEALYRHIRALGVARVHLVGHSLGGLVIRALVHEHPEAPIGRVVTLGSPHRGNRPAAVLVRRPWGRRIAGRSIEQLLSGLPERWALGDRELGTIAGDLSIGLGRLLSRLPEPNDGVVTLTEAQLPGASDHVTLGVSHTALVVAPSVAREVCHFLSYGRFAHTR